MECGVGVGEACYFEGFGGGATWEDMVTILVV